MEMHYEGFISGYAPKWPYPVDYGKENKIDCDVLVLGGGIAGCWAAIGAARKGVRVAIVEKGATKTSGAGGSGVDHWHCTVTHPASKITPEEYTQANMENFHWWRNGIMQYIACRESYDCLLDLEKMGVKIRDSEDEFKGAEFRDEATKILFAYDYAAKYCVRLWGTNVKKALYKECQRLGVKVFDHIMVTKLLNQHGQQGAKVVGATGVDVRTGEFFIFKSKASVLCLATPRRTWVYSTELTGFRVEAGPPNESGDGHAIAWQAGAEIVGAEESEPGGGGPYGYPQYGAGNAGNTWYACNIVDANGKEIPWVDRDGRVLKTVAERYRPAPGQKFFLAMGGRNPSHDYASPKLAIPSSSGFRRYDAKALQEAGIILPLYADVSSMPEMERKALWGLMIGQEARTLIPIYHTYTQAGFDPDKDMLQAYEGGWGGLGPPQWRQGRSGGLLIDWDLKTSLEGLYAAGTQLFAPGDHAYAATSGRYAGRRAADYAKQIDESDIDDKQVDVEKNRIFASVRRQRGMDWKELNAGVCKIMQDYCGEIKDEELLKIGLKWFDELETSEAASACARNPHELMRLLETLNVVTVGRMTMEACRARKASNSYLSFRRLDYPNIDPPEWNMWVTIKLDQGQVKSAKLPLKYYGDLMSNYEAHCGL
jgi:succinate dehydrogenase/fumarate reductase flavoprotein subunit